ncbi:MAG: hypothetical protein M9887_07410 [Chitinophagales bacterium]|nr:hypothetical protein [Chitinophagales bacterium]
MKKISISLLFMLVFILNIHAQNKVAFDSISVFDVNLSSYMTTNGKVYLANDKIISEEKYNFYKDNWDKSTLCKPCEFYTYRENETLKNISTQYEGCMLGPYKSFYSNGKIETEGQFRSNPGNDWSNLRLRGLCSVREGEWKHYDASGKLHLIETYVNGAVTQKELVKEQPEIIKKNGIKKIKGFFKKTEVEED